MRVRFTRPALAQLGKILDDFRLKNPGAAERLVTRVRQARAEIADNPLLGRRQDVEGVRRKVVQPGGYLIYYAVDEEEDVADILSIIHPSRQRPYEDI